MKRLLAALILVLLTSPAMAQGSCGSKYPDNPEQLAASLLPTLERLYAAIPFLSPQEEQWLKEEMVADGQRPVRAVSSREFAIKEAKTNAGSRTFRPRTVIARSLCGFAPPPSDGRGQA